MNDLGPRNTILYTAFCATIATIPLVACAAATDVSFTEGFDGGDLVAITEDEVLSPPGSPAAPAIDWRRPEVGALWPQQMDGDPTKLGPKPGCTATLIHREFVLTATHCMRYPDARAGFDQVVFHNADGTQRAPVALRADFAPMIWARRPHPDFPLRANAPLNGDVLLARLATPVDDITPATLDDKGFMLSGSSVSVFGYGGFGISVASGEPCTQGSDGKKRSVAFTWGSPWAGGTGLPWPVCGGDSGGPTFRGALPGTDLVTVTGGAGGSGSAVHFREEIFEQMRIIINRRPASTRTWVAGTRRDGPALGSAVNVASAAACETRCLDNASCAAWDYSGTSCQLRSYPGKWRPGAAASASGLRPLQHVGLSRTGSLVSQTTTVSPIECAARCSGLGPFCTHYNFFALNGTCALYAGTIGAATANPGWVSGVRQSYKAGVNMPEADIASSIASSPIQCASLCTASEECRSFSWVQSTNLCYTKFGTPAAISNAGVTTGTKRPLALPDVLLEGTTIAGPGHSVFGDHFYIPSPARPEKCRTDCAANSSCVAFTVQEDKFGVPAQCLLFSSVTREIAGHWQYDSDYKSLEWF